MALEKLLNKKSELSSLKEEHWIPLSDLMTGLMMMFMLIAILYMIKVENETQKIKDVAVIYNEMRSHLYDELNAEFEQDLIKWGAELDKDLTIRFKEPDVLFDTGKDGLKPKFIEILNNFPQIQLIFLIWSFHKQERAVYYNMFYCCPVSMDNSNG